MFCGIVEELVRVLVPHDPGQLGRGIVEMEVADQVGLAAGDYLPLHISDQAMLTDRAVRQHETASRRRLCPDRVELRF
jgi:hypothetical protein